MNTQTSPTSSSNARTLVGVRAQRTRLADTSYSLRRVLRKGGSISLKEGNGIDSFIVEVANDRGKNFILYWGIHFICFKLYANGTS